MFGKPQWFRAKSLGFGLVPVSWRGWLYSLAWCGAIVLPFLILVARHQAAEAAVWLLLALGALTYDVRQILRALRGPRPAERAVPAVGARAPQRDDGVLYILDSQPGQAVATQKFHLQPRG